MKKANRVLSLLLAIIFISSAVTIMSPCANAIQTLENSTDSKVSIDYNDPNWYEDGVTMVDCDPDWPVYYMYDSEMTKENILSAADRYFEMMFDNSSITDMSFCIFEQLSFVDSQTMDWEFRKVAQGQQGTIFPESISWYAGRVVEMYNAYTQYDLDWAQVCIDHCKQAGVRPWVYLRMNDMHGINDPDSVFHDSFFYEAKENGWLIGDKGYGSPPGNSQDIAYVYDFAHEEVREWMLNYIEEMFMRYDCFGYELDFMRNIYCFDYLNTTGYQEYMNDFIRKVNAIVEKAEEKHGHDIKLLVRLGHSVEDNYIYGFDVATWVKEDLVDALVPSCEEVINSDLNIPEWREVLGDNVALLAGLDDHLVAGSYPDSGVDIRRPEVKHLKGYYASFVSQGADGCYFNNFYKEDTLKRLGKTSVTEGLRTFMVTYQDITPIGSEKYDPLPLNVGKTGLKGTDFNIDMGVIRKGEYVYLTVGYFGKELKDINTKITLNGNRPVAVEKVTVTPYDITGHFCHDLEIEGTTLRYCFDKFSTNGEVRIHFTDNRSDCKVMYLDLTVNDEKIDNGAYCVAKYPFACLYNAVYNFLFGWIRH